MITEGTLLRANINNMEYSFSGGHSILRVDQVGFGRVFCTNLTTGEYLGDIGDPKEIEIYYDIVE